MAILSSVSYGHLTNPENEKLYDYLEEHCGELDEKARREVQLGRRIYEQYSRIPADEYVNYQVLINDAQSAWEKDRVLKKSSRQAAALLTTTTPQSRRMTPF